MDGGGKMFLINIMLIAIFWLNVIDYLQTIYMVEQFGPEMELNPLMRFLIKHKCAWLVKLVFIPLCLTWLKFTVNETGYGVWAVFALAMFYFVVVIHNFRVMKKFK